MTPDGVGRVVDHLQKIADGQNVDWSSDSTQPLAVALIPGASSLPKSRHLWPGGSQRAGTGPGTQAAWTASPPLPPHATSTACPTPPPALRRPRPPLPPRPPTPRRRHGHCLPRRGPQIRPPVAPKVLRPELAAVLGADRFLQEIKTTAQLQHPHILPRYDSGRTAAAQGAGQRFLY